MVVMPPIITVGSVRYRALLDEHRAAVVRMGIRMSVDAAEEEYCQAWARQCYSNRGAPSGRGEVWGTQATDPSWIERNYIGIKGTRAVVRALGGIVLCTPLEPDPGEDVRLAHGTYEVKTRQGFLTPQTVLTHTIGGTTAPRCRADVPMVLVNTIPGTLDVVLCGWITKASFLVQMFRCRFNGRPCYGVTAAALQSVEMLRP